MLFLSEEIYARRRKLLRRDPHFQNETVLRQFLELDPYDSIPLSSLAVLRLKEGAKKEAEEYLWRAVDAHPSDGTAYLKLAGLFDEADSMVDAVTELCLWHLLRDREKLREILKNWRNDSRFRLLVEMGESGLEEYAGRLKAKRQLEPPEVAERMRPYRLIEELMGYEFLDREQVDAILLEGARIKPLLVGVLRDWAQDYLGAQDDSSVANALAILGEMGDLAMAEHIYEFVGRKAPAVGGMAQWAIGRLVQLRGSEARPVIAALAAGAEHFSERSVLLEVLLGNWNVLHGSGEISDALLTPMPAIGEQEWSVYFTLAIAGILDKGGKQGVVSARAAMRRPGPLSKESREVCEAMIQDAAAGRLQGSTPMRRLPWTVYDICAGEVEWPEPEEEDDDEDEDSIEDDSMEDFLEEDEQPVAPVRIEAKPGRNDPCWCGSGKKYKKCHLDEDESRRTTQTAARMGNSLDGLRTRIGEFLWSAVPAKERSAAIEEFYAGEPAVRDEILVADWLVHDWIVPSWSCTVLEQFLTRNSALLTAQQRETLRAWSESYVGHYEVQEIQEGKGIQLKNVHTSATMFVHDVSTSRLARRWDMFLARVVQGERGRELTGTVLNIPRGSGDTFLEWIRADRKAVGLPWPAYMKANYPRVRHAVRRLGLDWIDNLQLANMDGEELVFSKAIYAAEDSPSLRAALVSNPEVEEDSEGALRWFKGGPHKGNTLLATFRFDGAEVSVECNSRQRLERAKQFLLGAGMTVRHLRDEFSPIDDIKRNVRDSPPRPIEPLPEGAPEFIQKLMADHYRRWPDQPLPALDGQTPRKAVETMIGRKKVESLLKDIENMEDYKRRKGEPAYDVSKLRRELGLDS